MVNRKLILSFETSCDETSIAVIENGERRSRLAIMTPNANILRLRDAIHP